LSFGHRWLFERQIFIKSKAGKLSAGHTTISTQLMTTRAQLRASPRLSCGMHAWEFKIFVFEISLFFFFFAVLGLELRTFTLSHSISPIFVNYLPGLALNLNSPNLSLPSN
jgi:hypothetical protein